MAVFLPFVPYAAYADVRAMRRGTRHAELPGEDSHKQRRRTTVRFQKNCRGAGIHAARPAKAAPPIQDRSNTVLLDQREVFE